MDIKKEFESNNTEFVEVDEFAKGLLYYGSFVLINELFVADGVMVFQEVLDDPDRADYHAIAVEQLLGIAQKYSKYAPDVVTILIGIFEDNAHGFNTTRAAFDALEDLEQRYASNHKIIVPAAHLMR